MADTSLDNFPAGSGTAETPEDFGDDAASLVKRYLTEIRVYDNGVKPWTDCVKNILNRYRNKWATPDFGQRRRYALLWSTVQTQIPAMFAHVPIPIVERRWKDSEDITASICAEVLQRAITYELERDEFEASVTGSVFDYIIAGRGVVWLRKEVDQGKPIDDGDTNGETGEEADENASEAGSDKTNEEVVREVLDERICVDEVPWSDFGHTLARNWKEVTIVWRKLYMTRDQLIARFGSKLGNLVELDYMPTTVSDDKTFQLPPHLYKLATVYEVWDKTTREAIWIALGYKDAPLDRKKDPLELQDFFPCPRPIYTSIDTTSLIPLPDYMMWEDQAKEVDNLTERLGKLISAARVRGAYDASFVELQQLFQESIENDMVPVQKWAEFANKGGIKGSIDFVPLEGFITAITELFNAREQAKRDAAEINGIGDILRGQNAGPEKTATESRISGQFGTLRLQDRQKEIQRFCRDIIRMMGELIAQGFLPETLEQMTGIVLPTAAEKQLAQNVVDQDKAYQAWKTTQGASPNSSGLSQPGLVPQSAPPSGPSGTPATSQPMNGQTSMPGSNVVPFQPQPPQPIPQDQVFAAGETLKKPTWDDVLARLRDDRLRSFTIDIETDSTIVADEESQKQTVSEFFSNIGSFMTAMLPVIQQAPEIGPFAVQMLKYGARRFEAGREMETVIDEMGDKLLQRLAQPQPPTPDPKVQAAQAQVQIAQTKAAGQMQIEQQKALAEIQQDQWESQSNMQLRQSQAAADAQLEQQKAQTDMQIALVKATHPASFKGGLP